MKRHLLLLWVLWPAAVFGQLTVKVVDSKNEPVVGALVQIMPDSITQVTDGKGLVKFAASSTSQHHHLRVKHFAYEEFEVDINETSTNFITLSLSEKATLLDPLIVSDEHAQHEEVLSSIHIFKEYLDEHKSDNLATSLNDLAGISSITTGTGIGKPVIRGLSANRVLVNHQGIKQEGQQWGNDHGLEIDANAVDRVEIVKGPASLQYGSDGLGGVINILPSPPPALNKLTGAFSTHFKTNNQLVNSSLSVGLNRNNWFIISTLTALNSGDYMVPATEFEYNDFVLELEGGRLKNTATQERNVEFTVGKKYKSGLSQLSFSQYAQSSGFFVGAVGIPRSYSLDSDGNTRDIDIPSQSVTHSKWAFKQLLFLKKNKVSLNLGYQTNDRQEKSFPEFHSASLVDRSSTKALQLLLKTYSLNATVERDLTSKITLVSGANAQYQHHTRDGFEFLLPNFKTVRSGVYAMTKISPSDQTKITSGIRFDYGRNENPKDGRGIYLSDGSLVDSLGVTAYEKTFWNVSGALGLNKSWKADSRRFKVNLGKSFRIPYLNETSSNGMHHGTFRHEMGTPNLTSEHGYQLDVSVEANERKWNANLSGFFNVFDNYIYLSPSGKFSVLPEAGQVYTYAQHDAVYTGFEADVIMMVSKRLRLSHNWEYVWNMNLEIGLPLPFTPPLSSQTEIRWSFDINDRIDKGYLKAHYTFASAQNRVNRNELRTPGYHLVNLGLGFRWKLRRNFIPKFSFAVVNLLNTPYLNHLSRYRILSIPEQGRNFTFSVSIPFAAPLKSN